MEDVDDIEDLAEVSPFEWSHAQPSPVKTVTSPNGITLTVKSVRYHNRQRGRVVFQCFGYDDGPAFVRLEGFYGQAPEDGRYAWPQPAPSRQPHPGRPKSHGLSGTAIYSRWTRARAYAAEHGIPFAEEWDDVAEFARYVGEPKWQHSLLPIRHEDGFVPGNVAWTRPERGGPKVEANVRLDAAILSIVREATVPPLYVDIRDELERSGQLVEHEHRLKGRFKKLKDTGKLLPVGDKGTRGMRYRLIE